MFSYLRVILWFASIRYNGAKTLPRSCQEYYLYDTHKLIVTDSSIRYCKINRKDKHTIRIIPMPNVSRNIYSKS